LVIVYKREMSKEIKRILSTLQTIETLTPIYKPKVDSVRNYINSVNTKNSGTNAINDILYFWKRSGLPDFFSCSSISDISNAFFNLMRKSGFSRENRETEFRRNLTQGKGANKTAKQNLLTPAQYTVIVDYFRDFIKKGVLYSQTSIDILLDTWKKYGLPDIDVNKKETSVPTRRVVGSSNIDNLKKQGVKIPDDEIGRKMFLSDIESLEKFSEKKVEFVPKSKTVDLELSQYDKRVAETIQNYVKKLSKLTGKKIDLV